MCPSLTTVPRVTGRNPQRGCRTSGEVTKGVKEHATRDPFASLKRLEQIESELESALSGSGVLVAHESCRGSRIIHLYSDGADQNLSSRLKKCAAQYGLALVSERDPAWRQVRHFTG